MFNTLDNWNLSTVIYIYIVNFKQIRVFLGHEKKNANAKS